VAQFICLCTAAKCTDERNNQGSCDVWNANKKGRRADGEKGVVKSARDDRKDGPDRNPQKGRTGDLRHGTAVFGGEY
jgi:hypothetical protein